MAPKSGAKSPRPSAQQPKPQPRKQAGPLKFPEGMAVEDALRRAMSTPPPRKE